MSCFALMLLAMGLLGGTFAGLYIARTYRERRDAAQSAVSGWRIRSQLPIDPGDPYNRFDELTLTGVPFDVMEGEDEGFSVSYFDTGGRRHPPSHGAIVQLPVEGPPPFVKDIEGEVPSGVATRTADVLRSMGAMRAQVIAYAVYVRSADARADEVHRDALRLAKAIVADAGEQPR